MVCPLFTESSPGWGGEPTTPGEASVGPASELDSVAKAGLEESTPLRLLNPFRMQRGTQLWITSPNAVATFNEVNYTDCGAVSVSEYVASQPEIHCSNPFRVRVRTATWLVPQVPLQPAFSTGWKRLPNELKLQILRHNLRFQEISVNSCYSGEYDVFSHHLRMGPEIAALSRELFYSNNVFGLYNMEGWMTDNFSLPSQDARNSICQLRARILLPSESNPLNSLLKALLEFPKLRHVELIFGWDWRYWFDQNNFPGDLNDKDIWLEKAKIRIPFDDISFDCKGQIAFVGEPQIIAHESGNTSALNDAVTEALQDMIRSKISFASDIGKTPAASTNSHSRSAESDAVSRADLEQNDYT